MASVRKFEWEAIAGVIAAMLAVVMHFLHVTDVNVLRLMTLALVALLFLRDLRTEGRWDTLEHESQTSRRLLEELTASTHPPEIDLVGPGHLRRAAALFAGRARGEVVWFNACPQMLQNKELSAAVLRPFLTNPDITTIRFVFDQRLRERWFDPVQAALDEYQDRGTVAPPTWADLDSGVSFMIAETDSVEGTAEALVSFWGEPFMAVHHDRQIPGYIIHVRAHSELIGRLREVERASRMA